MPSILPARQKTQPGTGLLADAGSLPPGQRRPGQYPPDDRLNRETGPRKGV